MNKRVLALGALSLALCTVGAAARPDQPAGGGYTLYIAGDIAQCGKRNPRWSRAHDTAALVEAGLARSAQAAVIVLGDSTYPRGTAREFAECYHPTWGRFKERSYPTPGNREYLTRGASGYFGYFGYFGNTAGADSAGAGHYSVALGGWRLISLDSNLSGAANAAQLAWLKDELARHPARCTLAYWHHPLYSSGGHGNIAHMREAWEVLYRAGAEIVLSGHDHDYERFAPQDAHGNLDGARGMRQFVVGTGGAFTTPFLWPRPNSEMRDANRTGVLKLVLQDGAYAWEFLEATYDGFPNGQPPDRGAGRCH